MGDERIRDLERRWQASGTLDDEVAYLRARQRAGSLSAERLALAASLGSPGAVELVGRPDPGQPPGDPHPIEAFEREIAALSRWDPLAPLQAATACFELLAQRAVRTMRLLGPQIPSAAQAQVKERASAVLLEMRQVLSEAELFLARGESPPAWTPEGAPGWQPDPLGSFFRTTALDTLMEAGSLLHEAARLSDAPWDPQEVIARNTAEREALFASVRAAEEQGMSVSFTPPEMECPEHLAHHPPPGVTHRSVACAGVVGVVARGLEGPGADGGVRLGDVRAVLARLRAAVRARVVSWALGLSSIPQPPPTARSENGRLAELLGRGSDDPEELANWIAGLDLRADPALLESLEALLLRYVEHPANPVRRAAVLQLSPLRTPDAQAALLARLADSGEEHELRLRALANVASASGAWVQQIPQLLAQGFADSVCNLLTTACGVNADRIAPRTQQGGYGWGQFGLGNLRPAPLDPAGAAEWLCARADQLTDTNTRRALVDALCAIGSPEACQPLLRRIAADPQEPQQVRIAAIKDIDLSDGRHHDLVLRLSEDSDAGILRTALGRFAELPQSQVLPRIHALLPVEEDTFTQDALLMALRDRADATSVPLLQTFLRRDDLPDHRRKLAEAALQRAKG